MYGHQRGRIESVHPIRGLGIQVANMHSMYLKLKYKYPTLEF